MAKILIVDDEEGYRLYPSQVLTHEGHNVRTAASGRDAIEVGAEFIPDVLITDWRLQSSFDGLALAKAIRAINPMLLTIMITGFSAHDVVESDRAGIFRILEKPFDLDDVVTAVHDALTSRQPA